MDVRAAAAALVERAGSFGLRGRTLSAEERRRLTAALPAYPAWLLDLLSAIPLCGLELGWQAFDPEPDFDGVAWLRVSDADGILWESTEGYPGLAILSAGYVNFGGDSTGGGDPYFVPIREGDDPPLYQVYHDVGADAATILAEGRQLVAPRLSEFLRAAMLESK
jgi:hypothetical protein